MLLAGAPESTRRRYANLDAIARDQDGTPEADACRTRMAALRDRWAAADLDLSRCTSWRGAALSVVEHRAANMQPLSAGEVAREVRLARPDLRFSVASMTRFVAMTGVTYAGKPAVEAVRVTKGTARTAAGVEVTVYAPTLQQALDHDFEVHIPRPGQRALGGGS